MADIDIADAEAPVLFCELDIYLVKFIQVLGITIWLDGDIVVADGCRQLNAVSEVSIQLQVEAGVDHHILPVTEAEATAKGTIVGDVAEIKDGFIIAPFFPEAEGFHGKPAHNGIEIHMSNCGIELYREDAIADGDTVCRREFFPEQQAIDFIDPIPTGIRTRDKDG